MPDVFIGQAGNLRAFFPELLHGRDAHATSKPLSLRSEDEGCGLYLNDEGFLGAEENRKRGLAFPPADRVKKRAWG